MVTLTVETLMATPPRPWRELGSVLQRARRRAGLSQVELAKRAHVSQAYVTKLERGGGRASPEVLRAIARPLGLDYDSDIAPLVGYASRRRGSEPLMVEADEVAEINAFRRLQRQARAAALAAGQAVERLLSPIEQVPSAPEDEPTTDEGDGEPER